MPRKRRSLTASGQRPNQVEFAMRTPVSTGVQLGSSALKRISDYKPFTHTKADKWQEEARHYFQHLGEVKAAIELTSKMVAACRLRAAEYNELGDECETKDERVQRVMRAFVGPDQGQRMLLRKASLNLQVVGECYLLGIPHEGPAVEGGTGEPGDMVYWEFLSTKEITFGQKSGEMQVFRDSTGGSGGGFGKAGGSDTGKLPIDCFIARLHRSDLDYSERATSQMQGALLICKELSDLTDEILASANSRLNAGILYVPQEFSFGTKDGWPTGDGFEEDDLDKLTETLSTHLTAPITNKQSQASIVPLIMRGPAEHADKLKWIKISRETSEVNSKLREELRSRLADALDLPREIMLGKGDLNHWCVDSDTQVYTRQGWESYEAISVGDEVWTLNHDSGQGEWAPVEDMYTADVVNEPMVLMEGESHRSLTTPDHRWPVLSQSGKAKWTTTETASDWDRIVLSAPADDVEQKFTDDFVRLLGWYSAEGTLTRREDGVTPNQIRIGQNHVVNPDHTAEIRRILCSVFGQEGWTEATEAHRDMTIWTLHADSRDAILDVVPGFEKIVPAELVDQFSPTQARLFVEAFVAADGSADGKYSVIHQVSEGRVDSIERACTRAGIATRRWSTRSDGESFSNDQHHISIKHRTTAASFQNRTETQYTGTIWCPVTRNRSWYAQKDGYSFFTGNTGFNVDQDLVTKHILPVGELIAEFVASSYLRPMLEEYEDMTPSEAAQFTVVFDASAIVARNDEAKTSQTLFKMGCLSKKTLLRSNGYSEADMPTDEEAAQMFLLEGLRLAPVSYRWAIPFIDMFKHLDINPAVAGGLIDPEAVDDSGQIDLERAIGGDGVSDEKSDDPDKEEKVDEDTNETNSKPPSGPADHTPAAVKEARFELEKERTVERILVAADSAYLHALERAASRFMSKATLPTRIARGDKFLLMSQIGPADLERVGESVDSMVDVDQWSSLGLRVRPWIRNLYAGHAHEVDLTNVVVAQLTANMHAFTIASFHNEPRLNDRDVYIPVELVLDAMEAGADAQSVPDPTRLTFSGV